MYVAAECLSEYIGVVLYPLFVKFAEVIYQIE